MTQKAIYRLTRTDEVDRLMTEAEACARARGEDDTSAAALLRFGLRAYIAQGKARAAAALPANLGSDAERLKRARERAGLSMGQLGRACGLEGHHHISKIEQGIGRLSGALLEWVETQEQQNNGRA